MLGLPYKISWFLREVLFVFKNAILFSITSLKKFAVFKINAVVSSSKAIYSGIVVVLNGVHQAYPSIEGAIISVGVYLWNLFLATKLRWLWASNPSLDAIYIEHGPVIAKLTPQRTKGP